MEEIFFYKDRFANSLNQIIKYCKELNKKREIRHDADYNSDIVLADMLRSEIITMHTFLQLKKVVDNPDIIYEIIIIDKNER